MFHAGLIIGSVFEAGDGLFLYRLKLLLESLSHVGQLEERISGYQYFGINEWDEAAQFILVSIYVYTNEDARIQRDRQGQSHCVGS